VTRRPVLSLLVCGIAAPVAYFAVGAAPAALRYIEHSVLVPVLTFCAAHPYLMLGMGLFGLVLVLAGLTGIGLARGLDVPMPVAPAPVPELVERDELDRELELLLDAEATNPRGIRVPLQPFPLDRKARR
jgi:hypothetical protein